MLPLLLIIVSLLFTLPFTQGTAAAATPAADTEEVSTGPVVSGTMQFWYKKRFDDDGDGEVAPSLFRVQRVKLRVEGDLSPQLSYQLEIDPRSPLIRGIMRVEYEFKPNQRFRVGQFKTPFGY